MNKLKPIFFAVSLLVVFQIIGNVQFAHASINISSKNDTEVEPGGNSLTDEELYDRGFNAGFVPGILFGFMTFGLVFEIYRDVASCLNSDRDSATQQPDPETAS